MPEISASSRRTGSAETILAYSGLELLGDGLVKLPFLRALRQTFPEATITWLAGKGKSAYAGSLSPLVSGLLDRVVEEAGIGLSLRELLSPPLKGTPLAGESFDLVIDTQRSLGTSLILRRIPHRIYVSAAGGYLLSDRVPPRGRSKPPSLVRHLLNLVEAASGEKIADIQRGLGKLPDDMVRLAAELLPGNGTYVGIAPGAGGRHKRWPLDRFIDLARLQAGRGRQAVWLLGPAEAEMAAPLKEATPDALQVLQQAKAKHHAASPLFTIALARRMMAAVANDAGTGHMLAAADLPLVSLFGPTSAEKWAPTVSRGRVITAQAFGGAQMDAIPLDAVEAALEDLLAP